MKYFKSKKVQAILLILLALVLELSSAIIYHCFYIESFFPEVLYYTSQIVSSIFVTSGVVIAVWQYYLSSQSAKTDLEIVQVQRAIDLSEYYKNNILNYFPAIQYIFKNTGILEIIETINIDQIKDFDTREINRLFTKDQINKLQKIQESKDFIKRILEANSIYNLNLMSNNIKTVITDKNDSHQLLVLDNDMIALASISNLMDELLNNMEFFALHFSHNTADESVIYQSLHQTYLEIVYCMYYNLANRNTESTSKYYTNIIWLFDIWRKRKNETDDVLSQKTKSIQSPGTIINK